MTMQKMTVRKEKGFTLIELVMVIVILGILAAFALPRFADFGNEARISSITGLAGSMRSAASIAHARQIANNDGPDANVTLENQSIDMAAGYPAATAAGIGEAAQVSADYSNFDSSDADSTSITYFIAPDTGDGSSAECRATYTEADNTDGSESPISVTTATDGC